MAETFPMQFSVPEDNRIANWRPLVQWAMAIPHLIIAQVLGYVAQVVAFIGWWIILFTGRLPPGMAGILAMSLRYNARAGAFALGLTEDYPPFSFDTTGEDPGDYGVRLSVQPALEGRNRLTVFFRMVMLIPLWVVGMLWALIGIVVATIAWFAVLFTGTYPEGMRRIVIGFSRYYNRVSVYGYLLTDEYPSFSLTD